MGRKFHPIRPLDRGTINRLWLALRQPAEENFSKHGSLRIGVRDGLKQPPTTTSTPSSRTTRAQGTARMFHPARVCRRKFPESTEVRVCVALGDCVVCRNGKMRPALTSMILFPISA